MRHCDGTRLGEGLPALTAMAVACSPPCSTLWAVLPQISVVAEPAAGNAAYGPALTDVVVMALARDRHWLWKRVEDRSKHQ
ncbi:carboxyl transferase domain-containing protein [Micromonospora marina]|uniref:carboxyl transferase domain-containing protein n=1 Tax=Micromonospora marina TaxID=307120 RepID=UPI003D75C82F